MNPFEETREFTEDEVRDRFLQHVESICDYWATLPNPHRAEEIGMERAKVEGAAFSILALLDGSNVGIPGFAVVPLPSKEDKPYCIEQGENWFPENHESTINCDIGGCLHELFRKERNVENGE